MKRRKLIWSKSRYQHSGRHPGPRLHRMNETGKPAWGYYVDSTGVAWTFMDSAYAS